MIQPELLEILRCPETQQKLKPADASLIAALNERIARGAIVNRGGNRVSQKLEGGLVRMDETVIYPIRHNIPIMLIDEAIGLKEPFNDPQTGVR